MDEAINAVTGTRLWPLSFLFLERLWVFYAAAAAVVRLLLCNAIRWLICYQQLTIAASRFGLLQNGDVHGEEKGASVFTRSQSLLVFHEPYIRCLCCNTDDDLSLVRAYAGASMVDDTTGQSWH